MGPSSLPRDVIRGMKWRPQADVEFATFTLQGVIYKEVAQTSNTENREQVDK